MTSIRTAIAVLASRTAQIAGAMFLLASAATAQQPYLETGEPKLKAIKGTLKPKYIFDVGAPSVGPLAMQRGASYDSSKGTVTLPLYKGALESGQTVWYVLLEASDRDTAEVYGTNYASTLRYLAGTKVIREARAATDGSFIFDKGAVDFSPKISLTPGAAPNYFPPSAFKIGAQGDADYTPFVQLKQLGNVIFNAPTVAFNVNEAALNAMCDGDPKYDIVHDRVAKICPREKTVTLKVNIAKAEGRAVVFTSFESNLDLASVLESAVLAPRLKSLAKTAGDPTFDAAAPNYVTVNGQTGAKNRMRQGINSAIADGMSVIDVFNSAPTIRGREYSPIWNIYPVVWTDKARQENAIRRLTSEIEVLKANDKGYIKGLDGAFGPAGFAVNCPVLFRLE